MLKSTSRLKIIAPMVFFMILQIFSQAQNHNYFIIAGKIVSDSSLKAPVEIHLQKKNSSNTFKTSIPVNGRFRLELDYNAEYQLTFVQESMLTKTVVVNTELPAELLKSQENFPQFLMAIKLFRENQDSKDLYSADQHQTIAYSSQKNGFERIQTIFDLEIVEKTNNELLQTLHFKEDKTKENRF